MLKLDIIIDYLKDTTIYRHNKRYFIDKQHKGYLYNNITSCISHLIGKDKLIKYLRIIDKFRLELSKKKPFPKYNEYSKAILDEQTRVAKLIYDEMKSKYNGVML